MMITKIFTIWILFVNFRRIETEHSQKTQDIYRFYLRLYFNDEIVIINSNKLCLNIKKNIIIIKQGNVTNSARIELPVSNILELNSSNINFSRAISETKCKVDLNETQINIEVGRSSCFEKLMINGTNKDISRYKCKQCPLGYCNNGECYKDITEIKCDCSKSFHLGPFCNESLVPLNTSEFYLNFQNNEMKTIQISISLNKSNLIGVYCLLKINSNHIFIDNSTIRLNNTSSAISITRNFTLFVGPNNVKIGNNSLGSFGNITEFQLGYKINENCSPILGMIGYSNSAKSSKKKQSLQNKKLSKPIGYSKSPTSSKKKQSFQNDKLSKQSPKNKEISSQEPNADLSRYVIISVVILLFIIISSVIFYYSIKRNLTKIIEIEMNNQDNLSRRNVNIFDINEYGVVKDSDDYYYLT